MHNDSSGHESTGWPVIMLLIFATLSSFLHSCGTLNRSEPERPNLIFIFPDQMRAQTLGFLGEEPVLTPTLDEFAKESMVFTGAVSNAPVCSPFRAMLFSGKYPIGNGVVTNTTSRAGQYGIQLRSDELCWSDILKENGYSMGYIGKWHLEAPYEPYIDCYNNEGLIKWNEWCPPERRHGFDYWYAYNTYDKHMNPMYWSTNEVRDGFHFVDQWGPEHEADMAVEYIHNKEGIYRDKDKPFALVVAMNPPHMPYDQLPQHYLDLYDDREPFIDTMCKQPSVPDTTNRWGLYYRKNIKNQLAMVTGIDAQFARILNALKENRLDQNTVVVFTSDHGDCLGRHEMISKGNPYEESMNIPFLIRWPDKIKPGRDNLLFSVPDIYPTLLDLMGLKSQIPQDVEGISFAPLLRGQSIKRPTSQLYFMIEGQLLNEHQEFDDMRYGERGVRTGRYTLVVNKSEQFPNQIFLWDRINDPYQLENIAHKNPELVKKLMEEELEPWLRKTNDPWLTGKNGSIDRSCPE